MPVPMLLEGRPSGPIVDRTDFEALADGTVASRIEHTYPYRSSSHAACIMRTEDSGRVYG